MIFGRHSRCFGNKLKKKIFKKTYLALQLIPLVFWSPQAVLHSFILHRMLVATHCVVKFLRKNKRFVGGATS